VQDTQLTTFKNNAFYQSSGLFEVFAQYNSSLAHKVFSDGKYQYFTDEFGNEFCSKNEITKECIITKIINFI